MGAHRRGHEIDYDPWARIWRYSDTGAPAVARYKKGKWIEYPRACPKCKKLPVNGIDACMGKLPGVQDACCGHGKGRGYIQFNNGALIYFDPPDIYRTNRTKLRNRLEKICTKFGWLNLRDKLKLGEQP